MKSIFLPTVILLTLASCSLSQKINHEAKRSVFVDKTLFPAHLGIAIFDPASSKMLYQYQADKYFRPASNTKLATCYVAMKYLGDSLIGVQYQLLNDTTILIKGMGDPTVLHPDFSHQPLANFLSSFSKILLSKSDFNEYLGSGWAWDDYEEDYAAPRSEFPMYGDYVRIYWKNGSLSTNPSWFRSVVNHQGEMKEGISATRPWDQNTFLVKDGKAKEVDIPFVPDDATLASLLSDELKKPVILTSDQPAGKNYVYTLPTDSMLSVMMHRSDNFFAEQSLLMVSNQLLGKMNDRQVVQKILATDFAAMPQKPRWVDGSGLSNYNLFSPKDFVFILQKMKDEFGLERMKRILPTGGSAGTLSSLYHEDAGKIFAKTGTISGVVSLSGYLITEKNRLLIFSVLVNNHNGSAADIRKAVEKFLHQVRTKL